jgi:hypothetical protein
MEDAAADQAGIDISLSVQSSMVIWLIKLDVNITVDLTAGMGTGGGYITPFFVPPRSIVPPGSPGSPVPC